MTVIIVIETAFLVTSFLPGDSLLFITGLTVATPPSQLPAWLAFALILIAAVTGTQLGFEIGRAVGPTLLRRRTWLLTERVMTRTTEVFERLGGRAVVIGRFAPVLRALVPVLAGVTGMPRLPFELSCDARRSRDTSSRDRPEGHEAARSRDVREQDGPPVR